MFKKGDKVVCLEGLAGVYSTLVRGEQYVVNSACSLLDEVYVEGLIGSWAGFRFKLVEEKPVFDLKTMPWKILVNSPEEGRVAQKWLFSQGIQWTFDGDTVKFPLAKLLTNCRDGYLDAKEYILHNTDASGSIAPEIKLTFGVSSVTYPEIPVKETEAQKKMKELEDKQREIAEELAKLRESM